MNYLSNRNDSLDHTIPYNLEVDVAKNDISMAFGVIDKVAVLRRELFFTQFLYSTGNEHDYLFAEEAYAI